MNFFFSSLLCFCCYKLFLLMLRVHYQIAVTIVICNALFLLKMYAVIKCLTTYSELQFSPSVYLFVTLIKLFSFYFRWKSSFQHFLQRRSGGGKLPRFLFRKAFISPSYGKGSVAGSTIPGWWFLSFSILNTSPCAPSL